MLVNRRGDMTPYPMGEPPCRQNPLLLPLVWGASWLATRSGGLKVERVGMESIKPPYLVLSWHQGFPDYYIAPLALFPHRANYISDVEGFAHYGKALYRGIGCIPKRRYAADVSLVRHLRRVTHGNGDIAVVFPEARHSCAGINSPLPRSAARLAKLLDLPVVVLKIHGSYLSCPIWDEGHPRKAPLEAKLELVLRPEELRAMDAAEVHHRLEEHFQYDEYAWQLERGIEIHHPGRAQGLHLVLYRCRACGEVSAMTSHGDSLSCSHCGAGWQMDPLGRLLPQGGGEPVHIPHWFREQREALHARIRREGYRLSLTVRVEALPSHRGFVELGGGTVEQDSAGFALTLADGGVLRFSSAALESVHTEYDYRGKGQCLVLSTRDCCYYLYPQGEAAGRFNVTRIQSAAELFHQDLRAPQNTTAKKTNPSN